MKKVLSLILALVLCLSLCACGGGNDAPETTEESEGTTLGSESTWRIVYSTDDFGDVTEDSIPAVSGVFEGSFKNTATSEGNLTVAVNFIRRGDYNHYTALIDLKEYNDINATYLSSDTIMFKMKVGDEIIEDIMTGTPPNGSVYLGASEYSWGGDYLYNALYEGEDVRCIITIGSSEYQFTITGDNFASVCKENGYGLGAADLTVKEAVKIFLDDYCIYNEYAGEWIGNNLDKLELMNSEEIKQLLEGYFLEMSMSGGNYVPGKDDYVFPSWGVSQYSHSTNCKQSFSDYSFNSASMKAFIQVCEDGETPIGYAGARLYRQGLGDPVEMTVENNMLTLTYSDGSTFGYQCYKITDDLFVICHEDASGVRSLRLLLRCAGYEEADIWTAVQYGLETSLPLIQN